MSALPKSTTGFELKYLLTIMLAVSCTACGADDQALKVDPELQVGLDIYLSIAPDHGRLDSLKSLQFCAVPGEEGGHCWWNDKELFNSTLASESHICIRRTEGEPFALRALVAHELGHCLHRLPHSTNPKSIMYPGPTSYGETYWAENLQERLTAMFQE